MNESKITFDFGNLKRWTILAFLVIVLFSELQVTLQSPIAFGDEGFHVSISRLIGTEKIYPVYNPLQGTTLEGVGYSRPPLWNFIEASFYMLFGFSDLFIKFLMPLVSFLTGLVTYLMVKKIYSENVSLVAAALVVTIPSFVTYSVLFYTAVPFVFFATISLFSFMLSTKFHGRKYLVLTGLFTAMSILTNLAGFFIIAVIAIYALLELVKKLSFGNFVQLLKKYSILILLVGVFVSPWIIRNVVHYMVPGCGEITDILQGSCARPSYYQPSKDFAGRSAQVGTDVGILKMGIIPYLQFAYGFTNSNQILGLIGISFIPFLFLAGLIILAKRRESQDILVLISVFVIFVMFYFVGGLSFSGRAEDIARYFLNAIPIIGIVAGVYVSSVIEFAKKYNKYLIVVILLAIFALSYLNLSQKTETMKSVKGFAPSFFDACSWIKTNTPKNASLLSLHTYPTLYNCDRRANWEIPDKADILLSNNITLVNERLKINGIDYIFVQKFSMSVIPYGQSYPVDFVRLLASNNNSFQKVYENGPPVESCIQAGGCDGSVVYRVL